MLTYTFVCQTMRLLFSYVQFLEADVTICINCYLVDLKLAATLHDLEAYLCEAKGIKEYAQLRLGPLLSHHQVQRFWKPPATLTRVPQVRAQACT